MVLQIKSFVNGLQWFLRIRQIRAAYCWHHCHSVNVIFTQDLNSLPVSHSFYELFVVSPESTLDIRPLTHSNFADHG
jgi:hypothetical protein